MLECTTSWRVTVRGPFLTQTAAIGMWGVDQVAARDHDGDLYLPGTLLQGNLREAFEELYGRDPLGFARSGPVPDEVYPIHVGDFTIEPRSAEPRTWPAVGERVITRTAIDRDSGRAEDRSLRVIDCPIAPGETACFMGQTRFFAPDRQSLDDTTQMISTGLRWVERLGAEKGVGFGVVLAVEEVDQEIVDWSADTPDPARSPAAQQGDATTEVLAVEISVSDPLCISTTRINDNIFASDEAISGTILKGAMAWLLQQITGGNGDLATVRTGPFAALCANFARFRITTAYPCLAPDDGTPTKRPTIRPASIVFSGSHVIDAAVQDGPFLVEGRAPAFETDWKNSEYDSVADHLDTIGMPQPTSLRRDLRVHTAIDRRTGTAADEQLYAYDCVCPVAIEHSRDSPRPVVWRALIDFDAVTVSDRAAVLDQLRRFFADAVLRIGRTRARAQVRLLDEPVKPVAPTAIAIDRNGSTGWVVVLQSPALMADPFRLAGATDDDALDQAYRAYVDAASGGTLHLVRHFTTHRLEGGHVVATRFRRATSDDPASSRPYNPILLTERGGVLVVTATHDPPAAQKTIERWLRNGLPLPAWTESYRKRRRADGGGSPHDTPVGSTAPLSYNDLPFLPSNGSGEIVVNPPSIDLRGDGAPITPVTPIDGSATSGDADV